VSTIQLAMRAADAVGAYSRVDTGTGPSGATGATSASGFGDMLGRAMQGAVDAGHAADTQSMQAISGNGSITDVVTAVSKAELALQSTVAIRDRVVQAYQDIMRMAI
jgi:flagellar hook-basal body complex protein FliE